MVRVKATDGAPGAAALDALAPSASPSTPTASALGSARGAATVAGPEAALAPVFERLRGIGRPATPEGVRGLVESTVRDALAARSPSLGHAQLDRMAARISEALLDDPVARAALDRLWGTPG